MLTKDGTVKILDMGLARSTDENADKLTEVLDNGAVVGTADFISPEQAMNGSRSTSAPTSTASGRRSSRWSPGKPPFDGNTTQKLIQHQMKDAPVLARRSTRRSRRACRRSWRRCWRRSRRTATRRRPR